MRRLFIGFKVSEEDGHRLIASVIDSKITITPKIKWTKPNNFHVTSHFLGEVDTAIIEQLCATVQAIGKTLSQIRIQIFKIGYFPQYKSRLLAAYVEPNQALTRAYTLLQTDLQAIGIPTENRHYHPHITLARSLDKSIIYDDISINYAVNLNQFIVYESCLGLDGSDYIPLTTICLS